MTGFEHRSEHVGSCSKLGTEEQLEPLLKRHFCYVGGIFVTYIEQRRGRTPAGIQVDDPRIGLTQRLDGLFRVTRDNKPAASKVQPTILVEPGWLVHIHRRDLPVEPCPPGLSRR